MSIRNFNTKLMALKPTIAPKKGADDLNGQKPAKKSDSLKSNEENASDNILSEPVEDDTSFLFQNNSDAPKGKKTGTLEFIKDKHKKPSTIPTPGQKKQNTNKYNQKL